jgi:hypothetical protein
MSQFIMGLDLGQVKDFAALAIIERGDTSGEALLLRHLDRFPLGTNYTEIVTTVVELCQMAPLDGQAHLVVDQTGVGRAVVDMLRQSSGIGSLTPVTITAGQAAVEREDHSWSVPKKELVTCLQVAFQNGLLKMAADMRYIDTLIKELSNFEVKITAAANEVFGAGKLGDHDDLVIALALTCWQAHRQPVWGTDVVGLGPRLETLRAPEGVFLTDEVESPDSF